MSDEIESVYIREERQPLFFFFLSSAQPAFSSAVVASQSANVMLSALTAKEISRQGRLSAVTGR